MSRRTTVSLIILILLAVGSALVISLMQGSVAGQSCQRASAVRHWVVITHGTSSTSEIRGHLCDTLTIINNDGVTREIAFGPHENHVLYNGVAEKFLNKDQSLTITFDQVGSFRWHDHLHDAAKGYFTVEK